MLKSDKFGKFGKKVGISNSILKTTINMGYLNDLKPIPADPTLRMSSRVFRFEKGDIVFNGIQKFSAPSKPGETAQLAIVGGTGKYKNISGYLKMEVLAADPSQSSNNILSPVNVLCVLVYTLS